MRKKALDDSKDLQQFLRDVSDEEHAIKAVVFSPDRGSNVTEALHLQRAHDGIKAEVEASAKRVKALEERAKCLQDTGKPYRHNSNSPVTALHYVNALTCPL